MLSLTILNELAYLSLSFLFNYRHRHWHKTSKERKIFLCLWLSPLLRKASQAPRFPPESKGSKIRYGAGHEIGIIGIYKALYKQ